MGTRLIKDESHIHEIIIYQKSKANKYEIEKINDISENDDCCIKFNFSEKDPNKIFFFTKTHIKQFNFKLDEMTTFYELKEPLDKTPDFGVFNKEQSSCVIVTKDNGILINLTDGTFIDLEE